MTKSMTGYGAASFENDQLSLQVEIKTLNSKFLDITCKLPKEVIPYENELRKIITDELIRGKVNFSVEMTYKSATSNAVEFNQELFDYYLLQINSISKGMNLTDADKFQSVMKFQDLFSKSTEKQKEIDRDTIFDLVKKAVIQCNEFRNQEGLSVEKVLLEANSTIGHKLKSIEERSPKRIENIKSRINNSLQDLFSNESIDKNRYEQELIFYIEKLDINEEIVRLQNHLDYFHETILLPDSQGKKLGFIGQEMGREINTIGSKANDSDMQKLVVDMKDELEKIKELVLNIV